ncbi:arylsulfatase [Exophiala aquamarina CBS 119918]|uniref:Arylsulfatase n=1 Tax=Exophiala aquamarina CBS 119918 TaxID=1182545 RepID=A0A072PPI1_9EURO|nr:arylsulfatase [Exophiala aquamarina CBS 119918]KEF62024.1 arylsulfatase [Exophiala aquamarina CBS 119918]
MAHNTNVTDVYPPWGGYPKFVQEGYNDKYLPVWLQNAGYDTYYTGKLFNAHNLANWNKPLPAGWNQTGFLLDPGTYTYYNTCIQMNDQPPAFRPGEYSTDIIANLSLSWLDMAAKSSRPFFLGLAPIAPHTESIIGRGNSVWFDVPRPAKRHEKLFLDAKVPRGPSFNPEEACVSWVKQLHRQNQSVVDYNDSFYVKRLQSLQAVDEMVGALFEKLKALGMDQNTYVIYTSDNGFHIGQHRLNPGKQCAFEEDVNVPFLIAGPGVPKNHSVSFTTTHHDFAATIFDLAQIPLRQDFDGTPMPLTLPAMDKVAASTIREHVAVEYWGVAGEEGALYRSGVNAPHANNTYKGIRIVSPQYDLMYTVWCNHEHELYDMKTDPYQTNNLFQTFVQINGQPVNNVVSRLNALLMVMKSCKASQCVEPWLTLHPDGKVTHLIDALDPSLDSFYANQPKVAFTECALGYIIAAEGAMNVDPYHVPD